MRVLAVVPGPDHHGVVRHGEALAGLVAAAAVTVDVARDLAAPAGGHDVTHVQFTDALFGPGVAAAADRFEGWAGQVDRPLVATLHDVPDGAGDPVQDAKRRLGYERVVAACDAVVVGTEHEAIAVRRLGCADPVVIPLPLVPLPAPGPAPAWAHRQTVGVLGFLYPGKGHDEVLDAVAGVGGGATVVALGSASPGHEALLVDLAHRADRLGIELLVTGPLDDAALHAAIRAVTVPVAAYRTSGSSASLATWLACGRRPIATRTPQVRELTARWPGAVTVCDDLDVALADALRHPDGTWSAGPIAVVDDVAAAHVAVYQRALDRCALDRYPRPLTPAPERSGRT